MTYVDPNGEAATWLKSNWVSVLQGVALTGISVAFPEVGFALSILSIGQDLSTGNYTGAALASFSIFAPFLKSARTISTSENMTRALVVRPKYELALRSDVQDIDLVARAKSTNIFDSQKIVKRQLTVSEKALYKRPSHFRKGVREKVFEDAKDDNGIVHDPLTNDVINEGQSFDMGHKPRYEFWKHQISSANRKISRKQFLNEYNNPDHYRPELAKSNRGHQAEDVTSYYDGD